MNTDAKNFLDQDKPKYSKSVWVELKNEEGDIVWLNWETGQTALKKPLTDKSEEVQDRSNETWKWI